MKNKLILGFILVLYSTPIIAQREITTTQKNIFLKWYISNKNISVITNYTAKVDFTNQKYLPDSLKISNSDSIAALKQIVFNNSYFFKKKLLKSVVIYKRDVIKKPTNSSAVFHTISLPIFYNKGDFILIMNEDYCGDHCGSGIIEIYKRVNNKYELLFSYELWVS